MRSRALFGLLLVTTTALVVSGCPGTLDDPQRFKGAGLVACDVRVEELFNTTCSTQGCHAGEQPAQGLDLVSPGVADRLMGKVATGPGCNGVLVDPQHPDQSFLYLKLTDLPPCGVPMPFGGKRLSARDVQCVRSWIAALAGDSGAPDAASQQDASRSDAPVVVPPDVVAPPVDARPESSVTVPPPEAAPPPPVGTGLKGEYFDEVDYTSPKLTRTDPTVDFLWSATQSPDPAVAADGIYSAKWTGSVVPEFGETYTFYAESDDGVRLTVNGDQLFDDQTGHATMEFSGSLALEAGKQYPIELRWFNSQGIGEIHLLWSSASRTRQIVPKERLLPAP